MAPKSSARTPYPVKLGDSPSMRKAMEDGVEELMELRGFKPNYKKADFRTGLGIVAVSVTLIAQFFPGKWPQNYWLSAVCLVIFCICNSTMELINWDDTLPFDSTVSAQGPVKGRVLVTCRFPKYTSQVKLMIGVPGNKHAYKLEFSVGELFDEKGYLVKSALQEKLDQAFKGFIAAGMGEKKKTK